MRVSVSWESGKSTHLRTGVDPVHERQQLGDDALLDFPVGLLALRGDRVDLVNEDNRRSVLLSLQLQWEKWETCWSFGTEK